MREISLIKNIEYGYKYKVVDKERKIKDGDCYINDNVKLAKEVYNADELVRIDKATEIIVNQVKNSFIETFNSRGGATKEQINFAEETAKVVFGKFLDEYVIGIPAPCGFGKSSISLEILKKLIQMIKEGITTNGLILVTDRLEGLRKTESDLKELGLDGYTYILEGWNENICKNKKVKDGSSKMCTPKNCPHFYKCKIYEQQEKQKEFPILLITNARLRECGESIKQYSNYYIGEAKEGEEREKGERTVLLIDERPDVLDNIKVNRKLLNEISTEISKCEFETVEEKTEFENLWDDIQNTIENRMQKLRKKYKRFIVSNINNEIICKTDERFMELWEKYMKWNYKRELKHIHTILTQGGFYVYEKNVEFITTIGSRDLNEMYSDTFKTIVFDGTALYDPLYLSMYRKKSVRFLDIENTRLYENLHINAYVNHKLTKSIFREKSYYIKACADMINAYAKRGFSKKVYVVSYQPIAVKLGELLSKTPKVPLDEGQCYYFGNTKGKNDMQECNSMFQLGWDTMPDYEYVIQWLSVAITDWGKYIELCSDLKFAEEDSEKLEVKDRKDKETEKYTFSGDYHCYEFGFTLLNQFKMFTIITNFYQEVHRIKLRNYNCTKEKIEVNLFAQKNIIFDMIEQLFPKCNMTPKKESLNYFSKAKDKDFKKKDGTKTNAQKFMDWEEKFKDKKISIDKVRKQCGFTSEDWRNLKKNKSIKSILLKYETVREGKDYFLVKI